MKKNITFFFAVFITLFIIGFVVAHISGQKDTNLKKEAVNTVARTGDGNFIYKFPDRAILYNSTTKEIKDISQNDLLQNPTTVFISEAGTYISVALIAERMIGKSLQVKMGNKKAQAIYLGVVIVGGIGGYGLGYFFHDKYFPSRYSDKMWDFMHKKENWEDVCPQIVEKEKFITF